MLPSISTAAPSTRNGLRSALRRRPTSAVARSSPPVPMESTTNSSPPTRATVSASRTTASNRRASVFRTVSPARWPLTSFTSLKPSRSIAISVNGSPDRRDRRNACSMRSSSSARFGSPVSGSRRASECAVSSLRLRKTPTAAATNAHSDESGDDVVGRLAQKSRREARDEHERGQAQRPHERAP